MNSLEAETTTRIENLEKEVRNLKIFIKIYLVILVVILIVIFGEYIDQWLLSII